MANFPEGTGLLDTPADWESVGFGWGVTGDSEERMLESVVRECGRLLRWQLDCLLSGHAAGVADRAAYLADLAAAADLPPATEPIPW